MTNIDQLTEVIKEDVKRRLDQQNEELSDRELYGRIEDCVFEYTKEIYVSIPEKMKIVQRIYHSFRGLDVLQPLMEDPDITEIMVNSEREIFIEKQGMVSKADFQFESQEKLEDIIQSIVSKVNRVVNESSPIVDARLQDGSRIHVVLPPIALKGPTLTIRKFPNKRLTIEDLVAWGSLNDEMASFLKDMVEAKYNIFISGGTGSGKTTLLNVLSNFIPEDERVITIEDSAELRIASVPNLVGMETRNPNTEGRGEITIRDLIRASLRMRPNRIVVGEVRGAEALDMLQAMNTGHDGSLSTGHANSTKDMLGRIETMVLSGSPLPLEVIRQQISSAIDIMIHLSRLRDKSRKIVEIHEMIGIEHGEVKLNPLFLFQEHGESNLGVQGEWRRVGSISRTEKLELAGLTDSEKKIR